MIFLVNRDIQELFYVLLLKSRSTEKLEVSGPIVIYIWSVWIFAVLFSAVFGCSFKIACPFLDFYQNYMAFWPLTSSLSVEWDFNWELCERKTACVYVKLSKNNIEIHRWFKTALNINWLSNYLKFTFACTTTYTRLHKFNHPISKALQWLAY